MVHLLYVSLMMNVSQQPVPVYPTTIAVLITQFITVFLELFPAISMDNDSQDIKKASLTAGSRIIDSDILFCADAPDGITDIVGND